MRHVYKLPETADKTTAQKSLRKLMVDDFSKFIGMLQQAERAHEAAKAARAKLITPVEAEVKVEAALEEDERDIDVDELIGRCLATAEGRL